MKMTSRNLLVNFLLLSLPLACSEPTKKVDDRTYGNREDFGAPKLAGELEFRSLIRADGSAPRAKVIRETTVTSNFNLAQSCVVPVGATLTLYAERRTAEKSYYLAKLDKPC